MTKVKLPGFRLILTGIIVLSVPLIACAQARLESSTSVNTLTIPVAAFIVDAESQNDSLSSQRTLESLENHFSQVNSIWSQAGIQFDLVTSKRISAPDRLLQGLMYERGRGGIAAFFRAIRQGRIDIGEINTDAVIWTLYVQSLGGPNGLQPLGLNSIFVVDNPRNKDYRVTSHEIGHVLGLYHSRNNAQKLLFSGSNGTTLNDEEKTVARYIAKRILR